MKRVKDILWAIVLIIANACNYEQVTLTNHFPLTCSVQSRSENTLLSLPCGSQILLNALGGLDIENEIFTYNGYIWENENDYHWTNPEEETHITALCPTYPNNDYSLSNLYSTGELEDILIAQKTYPGKENITLQFEHLFSSLTINIEEDLLKNIKDIQLTIPVKVNRIIPQDGTFSMIEETHIITRNNNEANNYTFIIPPMEDCVLTLTLLMQDHTIHEKNLNPHTFQSGVQYECNVSQLNSCPGIRTADDLISFSQLINGTYEGNNTLSDFGEQVDGKMVYSLLNDIALTKEDCEKLELIGHHTDIPFKDIFDGKGYTISNLELKAYNGYSGFFGIIDSTATIKNLHIDNCLGLTKVGDNSYGAGIIVGRSYGTISNCHITNSTLSNDKSYYTGGISGYTTGKIMNSSVKNATIESSTGSAGIITGYLNEGEVINSYSSSNKTSEKTTHSGGICGYAQKGTITNCYIYSNHNVKGQILGTGNYSTVTHCHCDKNPLINNNNNKSCTAKENHKYTTNFTTSDNTPVFQLLNQWIEEQTTYSEIFIHWKEHFTLPAVFVTP